LNFYGSDSFTYTITDPEGNTATATVNVTVTPVNDPPVLNHIGNKAVNEGETLAFTVSGGDVDAGDTLTYSAAGLPAGATFNQTTREFSYAPVDGVVPANTFDVTFTVTDSGGLTDSETVTITVNNVAPTVHVGGDETLSGFTFSRSGGPSGGYFTDPGTEGTGTWTAKVDYGDGSGQQNLSYNVNNLFNLSHTYPSVAGTYTVTVTVTDKDGGVGTNSFHVTVTPAIIVAPTSGLQSSESGGTANFSIVLKTQPTANVTINLASTDLTEGNVTPSSVTFTPANWNLAQIVTVMGVDDAIVDGDVAYMITTSPAISSDPLYSGLDPADVSATNIDNDISVSSLYVSDFSSTASGFSVQFNTLIDTSVLNLYDTQTGGLGAADVTLTKVGTVTPIRGSLIVNPLGDGFTFVKTGTPLAPGTYNVVVRSGNDAFKTPSGALLRSNQYGPVGDYTTTIVIPTATERVISVRDFARGPGQVVDLPPISSTAASNTGGIPIQISDGAGVYGTDFTITYNPALLTITGATLGSTVDPSGSVAINLNTPGIVHVVYSSPVSLPAGAVDFVILQASVPTSALYKDKEVLQVTVGEVTDENGYTPPTLAAHGDDGVHVVAYPGDTNGSNTYTSGDLTLMQRVVNTTDRGLLAYRNLDSTILIDVNNSGSANSGDLTAFQRFINNITPTPIPPRPSSAPNSLPKGGLDPKLSISKDLRATVGGSVSVPLVFEQTDQAPVGLQSLDAVISYDPSVFELRGVRPGGLIRGFAFTWSSDSATGLVTVRAWSSDPVTFIPGEKGEIAILDLAVLPGAALGRTEINLLADTPSANLGTDSTNLNSGDLVLIPAPTNAADDPIDGVVTIGRIHTKTAASDAGRSIPSIHRNAYQAAVDLTLDSGIDLPLVIRPATTTSATEQPKVPITVDGLGRRTRLYTNADARNKGLSPVVGSSSDLPKRPRIFDGPRFRGGL
jgi:hypothetical protein